MSKVEKDWTFVDDDGFLLMNSISAHYSRRKDSGEGSSYNEKSVDGNSDASGSDTEFEVVSRKNTGETKDVEEVEIIRLKEDHFGGLQVPSTDSQDDGSDIEVVKEHGAPPEFIDNDTLAPTITYEVLNSFTTSSQNGLVTIETASDSSTLVLEDVDMDESICKVTKESHFLTTQDKPHESEVGNDISSIQGFESLSHSLLGTFQSSPNSDGTDMLSGVAQLFERASNEEWENKAVKRAYDENFKDLLDKKEGTPQNTKTTTLVFIVCLSVTCGLVLGRALAPSPNSISGIPEVKEDTTADYNKQEAKRESYTKDTDRVMREPTTPSPSKAWVRGVHFMRLHNMHVAYQELKIRNSQLDTELRQLKGEYRLYRLYTLMMKRRGSFTMSTPLTRGHTDSCGHNSESGSIHRGAYVEPGPIPPRALSKTAFNLLHVINAKKKTQQFSLKSPSEEKIVELKRELLRQKRKADVWRQRYLNTKIDEASRCRMKFAEHSNVLSIRQCIQKFSEYFNFTDYFQSHSKDTICKNAGSYFDRILKPVSKLHRKVSCGLKDVGKSFGGVWQTLKGKWQKAGTGEAKKRNTTPKSGNANQAEDEKGEGSDVHSGRPPRYKWARFRKMLHISNIVGTLKNVVSGKAWKGNGATENMDGKVTAGKVLTPAENGKNVGSMIKRLWDFKKEWTQPKEAQEKSEKEADSDQDEIAGDQHLSQRYTVMSAIPYNVDVSYPQPRFTEPQPSGRGSKAVKARKGYRASEKMASEPEQPQEKRSDLNVGILRENGMKSDRNELAKLLTKEAEIELKEKFEHLQDLVAKRRIKYNVADNVVIESKDLISSLFQVEMSNVERMFRRYSNRAREERRRFQEKIRRLRYEIGREKKKLQNDKFKFNSWALQERLNIAQEYVKNAKEFKNKLQRLQEWKKALKEKVKKRKASIKAWLKEKLKRLLAEVEEAKRRAEHDVIIRSYAKNREQLKKLKKILQEERNKIKNVHKYYRYSIKKAKRKLDDEKKVYELAKVKAKELLATYEALLLKLRLEQKEARNIPAKDGGEGKESKMTWVYPSVFCPDQDSCTGKDRSVMKFTETPVVYCPRKDSCVEKEGTSTNYGPATSPNTKAGKDKIKNKTAKRSFRQKAGLVGDFANVKTLAVQNGNKRTHVKMKQLSKASTSSQHHDTKRLDESMLKSVHQLLAKFNKELQNKDNSELVLAYGKYNTKTQRQSKWKGPVVYQNTESVTFGGKRTTSVSWRGPLQYSPSTILLHDHYLKGIRLQKRNRDERRYVQVVVKGTTEITRSHEPDGEAVPLLYRNGLPRVSVTGNSSSDDSAHTTKNVDASEKESDQDSGREGDVAQNYALPLSWYMDYAKGREKMRVEEEKKAGESRWYFNMMNARQHARDHVDDSSDDWYMKMMEARRHYGENSDILSENWFLKMMEERGKLRGSDRSSESGWYFRMMQGRQKERDYDHHNGNVWQRQSKEMKWSKDDRDGNSGSYEKSVPEAGKNKGENSCYLRPDQRKATKKQRCWREEKHNKAKRGRRFQD